MDWDLGFGIFGGLTGPSTLGTLSFQTIGTTPSTLLTLAANDTNLGGFFSSANLGSQNPIFTGASLEITAVPIPATLLLFGTGLIGLVVFFGHRRRNQPE